MGDFEAAVDGAVARECDLVDEWEAELLPEEYPACDECGGGVTTIHVEGCSRWRGRMKGGLGGRRTGGDGQATSWYVK